MSDVELKKELIQRINSIQDRSFLNAIKTILDSKSQSEVLILSPEQKSEIQASIEDVENGKFISQSELDKEFEEWLNEK